MNLDDAPAPTRRAMRGRTDESPDAAVSMNPIEAFLALGSDATTEPAPKPATEPAATATEAQARPVAPDDAAGDPDAVPGATFAPRVRKGTPPRKETSPLPKETPSHSETSLPRAAALSWVDESRLALAPGPAADLSVAATGYVPVDVDLLADAPRRTPMRASVVVPTLITAGLVGAYAATTLMWPLHAVAPTVSAIEVQPAAAPATAPAWPAAGTAAVSVAGMPGVAASAPDAAAIASITKLVTALVVLDEMPLAVGEQGPEFRFTGSDRSAYWSYRGRGESALDVPVGGTLSQYQLLEGMLIGSANNYADRLAGNIWPSDAVYANAANAWLEAHGVPEVTIVEPTGMDRKNTASAAALIPLAQKALANPVIAEIVAKQSVELPGAGVVKNTNGLLADPGVLGLKTGTLDAWNLLSAKDVPIGDTTVRLFASVLGQPDDATRLAASRALYAQLEAELQPRPSVVAGTTAGIVETAWGDPVDIVTTGDASVILWNSGAGSVSTTYELGDSRAEGDAVGSLTVDGPLDDAAVELRLADDIEEPSPWWRLTHPLELFGLTD